MDSPCQIPSPSADLWEFHEGPYRWVFPFSPGQGENAPMVPEHDTEVETRALVPPDHTHHNDDLNLAGYFLWSRILEKYCATGLTKGGDKLIAISGLAKRMEAILDDEYVSGLWRNILPSQLLWSIEDFQDHMTFFPSDLGKGLADSNPVKVHASPPADAEWRAPSWSWAAVDGSIAAPYPYRGPGLINILEFCEKDGAVQGGLSQISGLIVQGALHFGTIVYNKSFAIGRCSSSHKVYAWYGLRVQNGQRYLFRLMNGRPHQ